MGCQGSKGSDQVRPAAGKNVIAVSAEDASRPSAYAAPLTPTLLPRQHWAATDVMGPKKAKCDQGLDEPITATPSAGVFGIYDTQELVHGVKDNVLIEQLDKAIICALKKFRQVDVEGHGILEREDLQSILLWLFERFHPCGKPLSRKDMMRVQEELSQACAASEGKLTFDDFGDWLDYIYEDISRVRRVVDWQQHVKFDDLDVEVIDVRVSESDVLKPYGVEELTEAAQDALRRHRERSFWGCFYLD